MDAGPLVLIVDDDEDTLEIARVVLEEEGYRVEVAKNGRAALERLRSTTAPAPALILLDLMMPFVDGATLARELESSAEFPEMRILVMTASGPSAATSSLPYPLLRKPFDIDTLVGAVASHCPRLWDEDEAITDEHSVVAERGAIDRTARQACVACAGHASTR